MPESMHKQGRHMYSLLDSSCTLDMKVLSEGHTSLEGVRLWIKFTFGKNNSFRMTQGAFGMVLFS